MMIVPGLAPAGGTGMLLDTCTCNTELARASEHVCMARRDRPILQRQHLFSVYIHRLPSTGGRLCHVRLASQSVTKPGESKEPALIAPRLPKGQHLCGTGDS